MANRSKKFNHVRYNVRTDDPEYRRRNKPEGNIFEGLLPAHVNKNKAHRRKKDKASRKARRRNRLKG